MPELASSHNPSKLPPDLRKLFPFQSRFQNIAGYQMHYIDEQPANKPDAPVVILVHGNPTWSFFFRDLIADLRQEFRVVAVDHLGCGLSARPTDRRLNATDRMDHLEELIDKLQIRRFSLVMHDWGGPIGTGVALRRVEAVSRMVYLNTTITDTESLPWIIRLAANRFVGSLITRHTKLFLHLTTLVGVSRSLPRDIRKGYLFPYQTAHQRQAICDFVDEIPFEATDESYSAMMDIASKLDLLRNKPVQILWGLKDPCFNTKILKSLVTHFPNAVVTEIPNASHLVLEDAPQLSKGLIRNFLQGSPVPEVALTETGVPTESPQVEEKLSQTESLQRATTVYHAFLEHVRNRPFDSAVVIPKFVGGEPFYQHVSFQQLDELINGYQRGLEHLGIRPTDRVLMLVPFGKNFLALAYAVIARGATPVFIDPGMGWRNLFKCIADVEPDAFIGIPRAHILRLVKPRLFKKTRVFLHATRSSLTRGPNLSFLSKFVSTSPELPEINSTDTAIIAFTSGATGTPKGVILTHEMMMSQIDILRRDLRVEPGNKDLPLLPLFSLFNLALGVCSVFPPIDPTNPVSLDPAQIVRILSDLNVRYSFGSPALWDKISSYCVKNGIKLDTLSKILMAGAPASERILALVSKILNQGEAYTPYGATEALPVSLVSASEVLSSTTPAATSGEFGTFVGERVNGVEYRIIEPVDGPIEDIQQARELPPLGIGEIIVKGKNISASYLNREEATRSGKIDDGKGFWHRMGDMGYIDETGRLYFCGRKNHLVHYRGRTFHSVPTERVFNQIPWVKRCALVSLGAGHTPGIVVEPEASTWSALAERRIDLLRELRLTAESHELTRPITAFFFHPSLPVDKRHSAKIFREHLSLWAQRQVRSEAA